MPKSIDSLRPREGTQPKKPTTPVPGGSLASAHPHSYTEDKENNRKADRRSWLKKHQSRIVITGVAIMLVVAASGLYIWQKRQSDARKADQKAQEDAKTGLAGLDVAKKLSDEDRDYIK